MTKNRNAAFLRSLWLRYFLIWPGVDERLANGPFGDVICCLAFGRNNIPDDRRHEVGQRWINSGRDDAVVLQWLRDQRFIPGQQNMGMAETYLRTADSFEIPLIAQWEVVAAMSAADYQRHRDHIICLWPPAEPGQTFNARDVLIAAEEIKRKNVWIDPWILTHRRFEVRAALVARKIFGRVPMVLPGVDGFDPNSVQPWTASAKAWLWREARARVHHILHQWV